MTKSSPTYSTWESDEEYFSHGRADSPDLADGGKECPAAILLQPPSTQSPSALSGAAGQDVSNSTPELPPVPRLKRGGSRGARFTSVKCTLQLNQCVDLAFLAKNVPGGNCVFDKTGRLCLDGIRSKKLKPMPNQARLYVRLRGKKELGSRAIALSIFSSGAVGMSGTKSYTEVLRVARMVLKKIRRTERRVDNRVVTAVQQPHLLALSQIPNADDNGIRTDMARADFDLGVSVKLDQAFRVLGNQFSCCYEPEFFAGLRVKPATNTTLVLYASGRGYVTGSDFEQGTLWDPTQNEVQQSYRKICGVIWANFKTVANLAHCRRSTGPR